MALTVRLGADHDRDRAVVLEADDGALVLFGDFGVRRIAAGELEAAP